MGPLPRRSAIRTLGSRPAALVLWALFGLTSFAFTRTRGLSFPEPGTGPRFVSELHSSGGDDNLCIEVGVVFAALALALHLVRLRTPVHPLELVAHAVLLGVQALYLAAIEQGSVQATVVHARNAALVLWLLALAGLWAWLVAALAARLRGAQPRAAP